MSTNGIQVMGAENVLQWYLNGKVPCFAIWAGKNLIIRYDGHDPAADFDPPNMELGAQILEHCLSAMYEGSTAIYTLKTYDLEGGEKIKPSTEYNTAFNFRLNAPEVGGSYGGNRLILEELKKVNKRIDEMEQDDEEPEKSPGILGALTDTIEDSLRDPDKLQKLASVIALIFGKSIPMQAAAMGNVHRVNESGSTGTYEQRVRRLQAAIETLEKADPKIVEHLEKLADVAKTNPAKFNSIISMVGML